MQTLASQKRAWPWLFFLSWNNNIPSVLVNEIIMEACFVSNSLSWTNNKTFFIGICSRVFLGSSVIREQPYRRHRCHIPTLLTVTAQRNSFLLSQNPHFYKLSVWLLTAIRSLRVPEMPPSAGLARRRRKSHHRTDRQTWPRHRYCAPKPPTSGLILHLSAHHWSSEVR